MPFSSWNPWHGCHKISEGCQNCFIFAYDSTWGKDASTIYQTIQFDLPLRKNQKGDFKINDGDTTITCLSSDFFIEEADPWRAKAWEMIKTRKRVKFHIITKRIARFSQCLPPDWGDGYDNVTIYCTIESQRAANERLPIFKEVPIKHKRINCEPLLENLDLSPWIGPWIEYIFVGGESGKDARICNFEWILNIRKTCKTKSIPFYFKQTGSRFIKENKLYNIPKKMQHLQAKKADINLEF